MRSLLSFCVCRRKRPPTDLRVLQRIYTQYYEAFTSFEKSSPSHCTKNYVPIDIDLLSDQIGIDPDILFGRLYYHLDHKYRYVRDDGAEVHFFALRISNDINCVHFPYLASILAELHEQRQKFSITMAVAVLSLCVAVASLIWTLYNTPQ